MSDGHEDERFDAFLERVAPEYHRPPAEVPREAMWEVVARARAATRDRAPASRRAAVHRPPSIVRRYASWIGMAATLLIGVGLGRYVLQREAAVTTPPARLATSGAPAGSTFTPVPDATTLPTADVPSFEQRTLPVRTASAGPARATGPSRLAPEARDANDAGYEVASREHMSRAEALVAVVATMSGDATMDSLMGRWARDVLTNTRLLLDSPAGQDPVRRRLLEDLETLLVQIVQRSGHTAEERELIDRTLQRTQLLTRLRSRATGT